MGVQFRDVPFASGASYLLNIAQTIFQQLLYSKRLLSSLNSDGFSLTKSCDPKMMSNAHDTQKKGKYFSMVSKKESTS